MSSNYWALEWDEEAKKKRGSGSEDSGEELFDDSSEYATSVEEEGSSSEDEDQRTQLQGGSEGGHVMNESGQSQEVVLEEIVGEQTIDEGGRVLWRNALDQIVAQEIDVEQQQQQQDDESENSELLIAVAHDSEQRRDGRNEYPNTSSGRNQENCVVEYMEEVVPGNVKSYEDESQKEETKIKKKKSTKKKRKKKSKGSEQEGTEKGKKMENSKGTKEQPPAAAPASTKPEPKMKKECPICDKVLSSKEAFRTHLKLHNDPEIFNCKLCEKCFKFKQSLDRHMSQHTGHFPFYCYVCEKGFVKGKRCRDHELVHLKEYLKGIGRSKTTLFDLTSEELQALKEIVKADFKNQQENNPVPQETQSTPPKKNSRKTSDTESERKAKYIKTEQDPYIEENEPEDESETGNDLEDTTNDADDNENTMDTDSRNDMDQKLKAEEEEIEEEEEEVVDDVEEETDLAVGHSNEVEIAMRMDTKTEERKEEKTYAKFYSVGDRTWKKKRKSKTPLRLKIKIGQQK